MKNKTKQMHEQKIQDQVIIYMYRYKLIYEKKVKDNIIWSSIGTNDCIKKKIRSKIR